MNGKRRFLTELYEVQSWTALLINFLPAGSPERIDPILGGWTRAVKAAHQARQAYQLERTESTPTPPKDTPGD